MIGGTCAEMKKETKGTNSWGLSHYCMETFMENPRAEEPRKERERSAGVNMERRSGENLHKSRGNRG